MTVSEYEERFRPTAPSVYQTYAAATARAPHWRRLWLAAAVLGVLITCRLAAHHTHHHWAVRGLDPTVLAQANSSATTVSFSFSQIG